MGNVKKGELVAAGWARHLRWMKREFWNRQRWAEKCEAEQQRADGASAS